MKDNWDENKAGAILPLRRRFLSSPKDAAICYFEQRRDNVALFDVLDDQYGGVASYIKTSVASKI